MLIKKIKSNLNLNLITITLLSNCFSVDSHANIEVSLNQQEQQINKMEKSSNIQSQSLPSLNDLELKDVKEKTIVQEFDSNEHDKKIEKQLKQPKIVIIKDKKEDYTKYGGNILEQDVVGDFKPQQNRKNINKSHYKYDYDVYYDLFEQYEKLQAFIDHPKISENANKAVKNTLIQLENFLNYIQNNGIGRFVIVNIPSYNLVAFDENYLPVLESKVVIGARNKKTPLKTINIVSLKYNPTWTPTTNMIKNHIMKKEGVNIDYLISHGLKAYQNRQEIPYEEIELGQNYRFSQPSGIDNALGVLKFETNSKDNIYLHDTNQPYLFNNKVRANSSGCIRVQNYLDLASWLTSNDNESENIKKIENNIHKNKIFYQKVDHTPVFFTYFQAFVNRNGKLNNFSNIYKLTDEEIHQMFSSYEE